MKVQRRTRIISEIERKFSFAVKSQTAHFFCSVCDEQREMLSINEAARRTGFSWREIVRKVEAGEIHSTDTSAGEIYICALSLAQNQEKGE